MAKVAEWRVYSKKADFNQIARRFNISPILARIIRNRDIETEEEIEKFLFGTLADVPEGDAMADMDRGTDIILQKVKSGKAIRIIGDYDVDGVMACYILYDALKKQGANVSYDIPHRMMDGYGLNVRLINQAVRDGVDTILTCDNGIAAFDAISVAKEHGLTVVVTDHHEMQEKLPVADAIIDIKRSDDAYPNKEICGAVVAYKFIQCLYKKMGVHFQPEGYVECSAIATVCDVMTLQGESRIFVRKGLEALAQTQNPGLRALLEICDLTDKLLTGYDMGFVVGPCINATGRLESAIRGMELLTAEDPAKAKALAEILHELNQERKDMTDDGVKKAEAILAELAEVPHVILLYVPGLHESLAGIVAGRIRETYYRPTIIMADAQEEGFIKGSGRSIEGYNMFLGLQECKDLIRNFGGHELAAGLTIAKENLEKLQRALNENETMSEEILTPKEYIDIPMPLHYGDIDLALQLQELGPFGKGNPRPLFAEKNLRVISARLVGKNQNVLNLYVQGEKGPQVKVIKFKALDMVKDIKLWFTEAECDKMLRGLPNAVCLDIAYRLDIHEWQGKQEVQYIIEDYRKHV